MWIYKNRCLRRGAFGGLLVEQISTWRLRLECSHVYASFDGIFFLGEWLIYQLSDFVVLSCIWARLSCILYSFDLWRVYVSLAWGKFCWKKDILQVTELAFFLNICVLSLIFNLNAHTYYSHDKFSFFFVSPRHLLLINITNLIVNYSLWKTNMIVEFH